MRIGNRAPLDAGPVKIAFTAKDEAAKLPVIAQLAASDCTIGIDTVASVRNGGGTWRRDEDGARTALRPTVAAVRANIKSAPGERRRRVNGWRLDVRQIGGKGGGG